uniref:60S ribosomal protein L36 n=2 Tax=Setaria italica TaxID=4555 RepID=K4AJU2_SETIT
MPPPPAKTVLFVGVNEGHVITKRELPPRPSASKGKSGRRTWFVRHVIREVAGLAPYEKHIIGLLRNCRDKRALKLAKRKLGTHRRSKKKREGMLDVLRRM